MMVQPDAALQLATRQLNRVREEIGKIIVGQQDVVDGVLICLLAGGHVLLEGVPGLGKRITEAILAKQYPALQSYVAIVAILYVVINFVIDILYSVLDPRIRNARAVA